MNIVKLGRNEHQLFTSDKCMKCGQHFILNSFMVHNGLFSFHLTCFKKYSEDKIKEHQKNIDEIRSGLERLTPYKKEMICESFLKEKYG